MIALGLGLLLLDLWTPADRTRQLGHAAAGLLTILLAYSFSLTAPVRPMSDTLAMPRNTKPMCARLE